MPGGDGTGPMGMGPMTGRAAGYCAGYGAPGFMNPGPGRGFWGRGRGFGGGGGRGRGWRNMYWATGLPGWARAGWGPGYGAAYGPPPAGAYAAQPYAPPVSREAELETLRSQADYFSGALEEIRKRIDELEAAADES